MAAYTSSFDAARQTTLKSICKLPAYEKTELVFLSFHHFFFLKCDFANINFVKKDIVINTNIGANI